METIWKRICNEKSAIHDKHDVQYHEVSVDEYKSP